jgi:hypothetical protein
VATYIVVNFYCHRYYKVDLLKKLEERVSTEQFQTADELVLIDSGSRNKKKSKGKRSS